MRVAAGSSLEYAIYSKDPVSLAPDELRQRYSQSGARVNWMARLLLFAAQGGQEYQALLRKRDQAEIVTNNIISSSLLRLTPRTYTSGEDSVLFASADKVDILCGASQHHYVCKQARPSFYSEDGIVPAVYDAFVYGTDAQLIDVQKLPPSIAIEHYEAISSALQAIQPVNATY